MAERAEVEDWRLALGVHLQPCGLGTLLLYGKPSGLHLRMSKGLPHSSILRCPGSHPFSIKTFDVQISNANWGGVSRIFTHPPARLYAIFRSLIIPDAMHMICKSLL